MSTPAPRSQSGPPRRRPPTARPPSAPTTSAARSTTPAPAPPVRAESGISVGPHLRASALLLVLVVLTGGIAYHAAVVEFGQLVTPYTANGSLSHYPNATVNNTTVAIAPALPPHPVAAGTGGTVVAGDALGRPGSSETRSYSGTFPGTVNLREDATPSTVCGTGNPGFSAVAPVGR